KVRTRDFNEEGVLVPQIIETTVGRVLFNEVVPEQAGYINEVLTKKSLRDIIHNILKATDVPTTADFLDKIKSMGYNFAFKCRLFFRFGDTIIRGEKEMMTQDANRHVDGSMMSYNIGLITNHDCSIQVIGVWASTFARLNILEM